MKKKAAISVGVIVVLLLLYEFFLVKLPEPQKQQTLPVEKSAQEERTRDILGKSGASSLEQFLASLNADAGENAVPQDENQTPTVKDATLEENESGVSQDERELTKEALRAYFTASSDLGFPNDRSQLYMALYLADEGDVTKIEAIIQQFADRLAALEALVPPDPAKDIHEASIDIIGRYIQLLKDTRDKKAGSAHDTWHSAARQGILADASALVQEIRTLVASYGLELPDEVLP